MKKYKLIETYPGSPVLGTEIKYTGNGWRCNKTDFAFFDNPDNHSKFWEEINNHGYEILSILRKKKLSTTVNEWTPDIASNLSLDAMLHVGQSVQSGHFYINSIKRLSDGEVFTIGDQCVTKLCNYGKINEFMIKDKSTKDFDVYIKGSISPHGSKYQCSLLNLIKNVSKVPLFTTEDGVDIFEGDGYYNLILDHKSPFFLNEFKRNEARDPVISEYDLKFSKEENLKRFKGHFKGHLNKAADAFECADESSSDDIKNKFKSQMIDYIIRKIRKTNYLV